MARRKTLGAQALTVYSLSFTTVNGKSFAQITGPPVTWWATVDPITGWKVTTLPEGDRDKRNLYLLSRDFRLSGPNQEDGTAVDLVVYQGEQYMVRDVMHFDTIMRHSEYRVMRVSSPIPLPP